MDGSDVSGILIQGDSRYSPRTDFSRCLNLEKAIDIQGRRDF